jgi:hypothetical protein
MQNRKMNLTLRYLLSMSLLTALCFSGLGYADPTGQGEVGGTGAKHFRRHHRSVPYLSSTQLSALGNLKLNEEQWKGFWKGERTCQRTAAKAQVTPVSDPSSLTPDQRKAERKAFRTAMRAVFPTCFNSQVTASNTPSSGTGN